VTSIVHHDDKNQFESKIKRLLKEGETNLKQDLINTDKIDDIKFLDQYKEIQNYEVYAIT
jgi:hypothetical protein